ncbi:MAG: hypothetical protein ABW166_11860 [Sedimenticola sp.]
MGDQPAQATALLMYRMYGMLRVHGCTGVAMIQDVRYATGAWMHKSGDDTGCTVCHGCMDAQERR